MNLLKCGCLVLLAAFFIADAAHARNAASGAYIGATVAQTLFDRNIGRLNDELAVVKPSETTLDSNSLGYSLYGGYRFNKYLAVDGGYMHFGKVHYHAGYRQGEISCSGGCTPRLFASADVTINTYGARSRNLAARAALDTGCTFGCGYRWILRQRRIHIPE